MSNQDNISLLKDLEQNLQFQSLLAELSANFVRVPTGMIDQEIEESLRRIAENLDLDFVGLGMLTADGQDFFSRYHYTNGSIKPWVASSLMTEGPLLTKTLLAGQPFIMHDLDELPPEGAIDREGFLHYGIRSDLSFPFIVGGHLCGGMGFCCSRPRRWHDHIVRGLGLISDLFANVLERKRSWQALQDKEEQMLLAAKAAGVALWVWNIPLDTIWATDEACQMYGVSFDETLNMQHFLACLHPEDCERIKQVVQKTFEDGSDFRQEYRIVHPDGTEYWIYATGKCHLDETGHPERLMGASLNITDSRQTQQDLERANDELKTALEKIRNLKNQIQQENIYLRHKISENKGAQIISGSKTMRDILAQVQLVAPTPASVLITGETGTGKELMATAIHEASSRKDRSMIRVNCAAIPAALIESELFGREKGAFTGAISKQVGRFELANGSTLFLDEVGELPLDAQAKLLRVLQEKEIERLGNPRPIKVDVRVVAATNRNLSQEVAEGRFREDLYYRLNVFPIHVPPLRNRREDIPKLVETFVHKFSRSMDKSIVGVSKASIKALCDYDWPGNIRELRNVIERAVILAQDPILKVVLTNDTKIPTKPWDSSMASMEEIERDHVLQTLQACGWRVRGQGGAAQILKLNACTLESRMKKLGIRRPSSL